LRIGRGSIYLERELCERYFDGVESVAAVRREDRVILMPLRGSSAGGLLLKVRNARGDRVVHAIDFLRTLGIGEETPEFLARAQWDAGAAGLVFEMPGAIEHDAQRNQFQV